MRPTRPLEFDLHGTGELLQTLEKEKEDHGALSRRRGAHRAVRQLAGALINSMIIEAHRDGVSDIHIESYPGREKIRIRFRKDGLLQHLHGAAAELPQRDHRAHQDHVRPGHQRARKPQDGKINFAKFSPQHKLELRVATIPTNNGLEDVVMRILASAKPLPSTTWACRRATSKQLKKPWSARTAWCCAWAPRARARRPRCTRR
jgi:type II secretory ATPase GspE/PulE/Tfp pilus assembly ATPase PilB-like protein